MPNPALIEGVSLHGVKGPVAGGWGVPVPFGSVWDSTDLPTHRVRDIRILLVAPKGAVSGAYPLVDDSRLSAAMRDLLEATAGVGSTTAGRTPIESLPSDGEAFSPDFGRDAAVAHASVCESPEVVNARAASSTLSSLY